MPAIPGGLAPGQGVGPAPRPAAGRVGRRRPDRLVAGGRRRVVRAGPRGRVEDRPEPGGAVLRLAAPIPTAEAADGPRRSDARRLPQGGDVPHLPRLPLTSFRHRFLARLVPIPNVQAAGASVVSSSSRTASGSSFRAV